MTVLDESAVGGGLCRPGLKAWTVTEVRLRVQQRSRVRRPPTPTPGHTEPRSAASAAVAADRTRSGAEQRARTTTPPSRGQPRTARGERTECQVTGHVERDVRVPLRQSRAVDLRCRLGDSRLSFGRAICF